MRHHLEKEPKPDDPVLSLAKAMNGPWDIATFLSPSQREFLRTCKWDGLRPSEKGRLQMQARAAIQWFKEKGIDLDGKQIPHSDTV